jgi:glutathione synthase/RimK-type ligase-like ATP-grasp enzyme
MQAAEGARATARPASYRPNFVAQLTNAAMALGAEIAWLSSDYIAALTCGSHTAMVVGYHFPLNNAAACALADDKSATADVLAWVDVPHVRHVLMRFDSAGLAEEIDRVAELFGFPLVIKPHRGTGGQGVTRVTSPEAMAAALTCLRGRYEALAACPWLDIAHEYRVVVLDGQARLIFEKVRALPDGDWRNNLKYGSVPVMQADDRLTDPLAGIALRAAAALGLRFTSVDVVASPAGLEVLEVNSGVCLERFSGFSTDHFDRASAVYVQALRACLGGTTPS